MTAATEDIINCFDCKNYWGGLGVVQIIDLMADLGNYTGPGHWNDADMLEVGNGVLTPPDGGDFAFCLINRGKEPVSFDQDLKTTIKKVYTIDDSFFIRDLWKHQEIGTTKENLKGILDPHDVMLVRLRRGNSSGK